MTVHRIQVMASDDVAVQKTKDKIANLKNDYGEKLSKENAPFDSGETMDGSVSFYQGSFIVTLNESNKTTEKNDLLEQIVKEMDKSASWWQLRWHECTHDDTEREVEKTRELPDGSTETYTEIVKGCAWETKEFSDKEIIPNEVIY